jgi:hypothetical protein
MPACLPAPCRQLHSIISEDDAFAGAVLHLFS